MHLCSLRRSLLQVTTEDSRWISLLIPLWSERELQFSKDILGNCHSCNHSLPVTLSGQGRMLWVRHEIWGSPPIDQNTNLRHENSVRQTFITLYTILGTNCHYLRNINVVRLVLQIERKVDGFCSHVWILSQGCFFLFSRWLCMQLYKENIRLNTMNTTYFNVGCTECLKNHYVMVIIHCNT